MRPRIFDYYHSCLPNVPLYNCCWPVSFFSRLFFLYLSLSSLPSANFPSVFSNLPSVICYFPFSTFYFPLFTIHRHLHRHIVIVISSSSSSSSTSTHDLYNTDPETLSLAVQTQAPTLLFMIFLVLCAQTCVRASLQLIWHAPTVRKGDARPKECQWVQWDLLPKLLV